MRIIANRKDTGTNDRFGFHLKEACKDRNVNIAVAFFTEDNFIDELLSSGARIQMIVRLNRGTSPYALRKVFGKENLTIRYFPNPTFHPKLYIVEHSCAFVGSSNLTRPALGSNAEINIAFDYEEDEAAYSELADIFQNYWIQAVPLDKAAIDKLEALEKKYPPQTEDYPGYQKELGDTAFDNKSNSTRKNQKRSYIESFKREYQKYLEAYRKLSRMYSSTPDRKWPEEEVPLRIEIDRFLWWIREFKCPGPKGWVNDEEYPDEKIQRLVIENKAEYVACENEYLDSIAKNYKIVADGLASPSIINELDEDELFDILNNVHAFHDTFRFKYGGLSKLKEVFFHDNTLEKIKASIIYLIFSEEPAYEERIFDCVKGNHKLAHFGDSCVKELYGYVNDDNIPICNGRTIKSMEWLGFEKL